MKRYFILFLKTAGLALLSASILYFNAFYDVYQLTKTGAVFFFAFLLFSVSLFTAGRTSFSPGIPGLAAFIFILYLILRTLFSDIPAPSYYLAAVFSPVFVFAAMYSVFPVKKFLVFINILAALSVSYAFLQYASGIQRPYSFFGNPIFLSEFLLINFSLVIISAFYFRKNTFYFTLNALGILVVMALSSSRGPLISVLIQFILLSFILIHNRYISLKKILLYSFSVFFSAVIISGLLFSVSRDTAFPERFSPKTLLNSPAFNNRLLMGKTAYALGLKSPVFGSGPGSYKYYHPFYQSFLLKKDAAREFVNTSYAHNDYMQYFSEFGIAGLLLFLVFLFACAARFDASYPYLEKKHLLISSALACSLFSVIIESFFNFPLFVLPSAFLFWYYSGLFLKFSFIRHKTFVFPGEKSIAAGAAVFTAVFIVFSSPFLFSNFYLKHAINLDAANEPLNEKYFKKSVSLYPSYFYTHYYLGASYSKSLKLRKASESYKKALDIQPYSPDIHYNLASVFFKASDYSESEKYIQKTLSLYPGFIPARLLLVRIYSEQGNDEAMIKQLSKISEIKPGFIPRNTASETLLFKEITP